MTTETKEIAIKLTPIQMLHRLQTELNVPKNRKANFGGGRGYAYRNSEDILTAVKPLLTSDYAIHLQDEIAVFEGVFYIKATASLVSTDLKPIISSSAYARENHNRSNMDPAQASGATSSYARKYALCALLAIDDGNDVDSLYNRDQNKPIKTIKPTAQQIDGARVRLVGCSTKQQAAAVWTSRSARVEGRASRRYRNVKKQIPRRR